MGRGKGSLGKGSAGGWWSVQRVRLLFERGLLVQYPSSRRALRSGFCEYEIMLPVPFYEDRRLRVEVYGRDEPRSVRVYANGPTESPHRYPSGALCMWHPDDNREQRWEPRDGLLALIDLAVLHLFREAWWRETGQWRGPEAAHGADKIEVKSS